MLRILRDEDVAAELRSYRSAIWFPAATTADDVCGPFSGLFLSVLFEFLYVFDFVDSLGVII